MADIDHTGLDEATMPDAALMGDPMDDLFGDAADGLGVALPPIPLPAPLIMRILELQRNGFCTTMTWSNIGSLALITKSGAEITFRALARNAKSGKWDLSKPAKSSLLAPEGRHFVHIQFNGLGIEFAAIDNLGCVHIYTISSVLSRLLPSQMVPSDRQHTEQDTVVGFFFLPMYPQEFRAPYISKAVKAGSKWVSNTRPRESTSKVYHPSENKNALIYVTSAHCLALLYQNEGGVWHSVSTELETFDATQQLLTHATVGENGDHLLVATHDKICRLRLYKVSINWNSQIQQRNSMNISIVAPALDISHLTAISSAAPQLSDAAKLTHLKLLPAATADNAGQGETSGPVLFAIFTHVVSPVGNAQHSQDSFGSLARWAIESQNPTLHESFVKLKKNGSIPTQKSVTRMHRLPDIMTSRTILTVDLQFSGTILALGASDGTIEFRDPYTFESLEFNYGSTEEVPNLSQSGFEQVPTDHHPTIALSTDGSFVAYTRHQQVEVKAMALRYGWQHLDDGMTDGKGTVEAAVVCLARQFAHLCFSSMASDDPLALLPSDLSQDMRDLFFREVIRMARGNPDISLMEPQKQQLMVLREPFIHRALSALLILGLKPGTHERTFPAQFAYVVLNLRLTGTALAQTLGQKNPDLSRADIPPSLVEPVRWAIELMAYVMDALLEVKRKVARGIDIKQAFENYASESQSPAIQLLLCSLSRAHLRCYTGYIQKIIQLINVTVPRAQSIPDRQQMIGLLETVRQMPFTTKAFQDVINEFDTAIRQTYSEMGNTQESAERRGQIEVSLMLSTTIPDELIPALQTLVDRILPAFKQQGVDQTRLFFYDVSKLQIHGRPRSGEGKKFDAIKKTPLTEGMKLRYCRRCGAQMEDIPQEQVRQIPPWMGSAQRHCYCLNYWWMD